MPAASVTLTRSAYDIQGVTVDQVDVERPDGVETRVFLAPSLGCHVLGGISRRKGIPIDIRTTENLQLGDPDPALFEVPAGYRFDKLP